VQKVLILRGGGRHVPNNCGFLREMAIKTFMLVINIFSDYRCLLFYVLIRF